MNDIYSISDSQILQLVGYKIKRSRLAQNITQASVAKDSEVPLSTIRRIERGEIGSMSSLLRVMRVLGMLDLINPITEEEKMSPNEYLKLMSKTAKKKRQRAYNNKQTLTEEESEW